MWFPSKKLADKSAALEAVKRLDQAGELDDRLKPIAKSDDSDTEDEESAKGTKVNTERKTSYYRNKVCQ